MPNIFIDADKLYKMKGLFITFERIECCVKSTQAKFLAEYLKIHELELFEKFQTLDEMFFYVKNLDI